MLVEAGVERVTYDDACESARRLAGEDFQAFAIQDRPYLALMYRDRVSEFWDARQARLRMGFFRYNTCGRSFAPVTDMIVNRLQLWSATGNLEMLVDVANLCVIESAFPSFEGTYEARYHMQCADPGDYVHSYEWSRKRGYLRLLYSWVLNAFCARTHPFVHFKAVDR
jgi:hypothetical protein